MLLAGDSGEAKYAGGAAVHLVTRSVGGDPARPSMSTV